jgi:hypothetical protein
MILSNLLVVGGLLIGLPAHADNSFAPIPADQTGGRPTGLEMRIVKYEGGTNGIITVDVRNGNKQATEFTAKGLYFVPTANADTAPQRLGAVGPFQQKTGDGWQRAEKTSIPAGATVQLKLDIYCIDSHRGSPSASTSFRIAKDRVPKDLSQAIDQAATAATAGKGGVSAPANKPAVQSEVWTTRDRKWIKLDGEGKQEDAKKR